MAEPNALDQARAAWVKILEGLDDGAFVPIDDFEALPLKVRYHCLDWHRLVFKEGRAPERARPKAALAVHLARPDTVDFVRFDWRLGKMRVTVFEASSFLFLLFREIPKEELGEADPLSRAVYLANVFLAASAPLKFEHLPGDPATISSAPDVRAEGMDEWSNRVDGRVRADGLLFLVFKFHLERWDADSPPARWFDDEFRKKVKP